MPFSSLHLFFFSGTGNSYRAAQWMGELARSRGVEASVAPIAGAEAPRELGPGDLVGLVCPTHAFCAPWAMLRFALGLARGLPRGHGAGAFAVLTRAGMKVGRWYVPGLEGSGAYLLALILLLRGYRPLGAMGLDMPATWTVVMPALSPAAVEGILARARPRVERFLGAILDGRRCFWSLLPLLLGILLLPVTFAYMVMGRFFLARLFYPSAACDGCGLCARSCPVNAIRMRRARFWDRSSPPRPYWTFLCESCTRCMNFCPKQAVEASYPFGALVWYAINIPAAVLLLNAFARWIGLPLANLAVLYAWRLLALAVAYGMFWLALRISPLNRLFTLLTPTHYYRRYREPGARLKDL